MASTLLRVTVEATAITGEVNTALSCREIIFISNDGAYPIIFNMDAATTASGAFTVKAGEQFTGLDWGSKQLLYYKSVGGSSAFRLWAGG